MSTLVLKQIQDKIEQTEETISKLQQDLDDNEYRCFASRYETEQMKSFYEGMKCGLQCAEMIEQTHIACIKDKILRDLDNMDVYHEIIQEMEKGKTV